jgi:hypothetical protein
MTLIWPLQVALVARLKADAAVAAIVADRVYDGEAPPNAAFPRIVVGEATEVPGARALEGHGHTDTVTLHLWSAYAGRQEAAQLLGAVNMALAEPLVLDGYGRARLRQEFVTTLTEEHPAGTIRHIPARFRVTAWPS